ncbi:isoprenylcysteine carboxyl methyltransferase family protein [Pseudosulfitobacter koreensis]|uniref:Isoprenylcysteine carboxyl methyltransferase (ICMT) family protein n=1 Tax=Pseudosulfitobacter koreensis TaxID=2968472 RepID=A0ABT1Z463_9RHOB|nr:isoprenylcysteine carboxylmethyltransferase family protein [Pseudosulfitobacter koreense]MCR8827928.1 hypothetical protein [Pseudosulfitobacter koreense]
MLEPIFIALAVSVRLATLAISMRNERILRARGAVEHGAMTSKAIALAHVAFYLCAIAEGIGSTSQPGWTNDLGIIVYILSVCALFWVIATLGRLWTVKLYIAPDHRLATNWLFRRVRHPNYFLNIIPELIGLALVLDAWVTLAIGLPLYLVILALRIREEERIMGYTFAQY